MIPTKEEHIEILDMLKEEELIQYSQNKFSKMSNDGIKQMFIFRTWDYLKLLYKDNLKTVEDGNKKRLFNIPGDPNEYSMLNFVASNQFTFPVIVNYFNKKIIDSALNGELIASSQLSFDDTGDNWETEMNKLLKLYHLYYGEILTQQDNGIFDTIVKIIEDTNKRGDLSEKEMLKFIKMIFPLAKDFQTGGQGKDSDIVEGIDIQFTWKGKTKTLQQKRCSRINLSRRYYYVNGVGGIKEYGTSFYGFQTADNRLYIFENDSSVKVKEYNGKKKYVFPERQLKFETKI